MNEGGLGEMIWEIVTSPKFGIHDYYAIGWDRSQKSPNELVLFTRD